MNKKEERTNNRFLWSGRHNATFRQVLRHKLLVKTQEITEAPPNFKFLRAKLRKLCLQKKSSYNIFYSFNNNAQKSCVSPIARALTLVCKA